VFFKRPGPLSPPFNSRADSFFSLNQLSLHQKQSEPLLLTSGTSDRSNKGKGQTLNREFPMEKTASDDHASGAERRESPRIKRSMAIKASRIEYPMSLAISTEGAMVNLSRGGVQFTCSKEFDLNSLVQLNMTLPGWTKHHPGFIRVYEDSIGRPFTAVGEVLRCDKSGDEYSIATRFVNIDSDDMIGFEGYLSAKDLV
jgi:hypothetical protein